MTTKGSGSYANGFPLTNSAADLATNGAYVVIRPGRHALTVRYWIKDYATNVEGAITKTYPAFDYEKNDYYDMTANINVTDYDGSKYYMWDAQKNYWNGHEWNSANPWQPVLANESNSNFPTFGSDRYFHENEGFGRMDATSSCKNLPNANELGWYVKNGDPRWDDDKLWTAMGHLYKGGMWFREKSLIRMLTSFQPEQGPGYTDMRDNFYKLVVTPTQGAPVNYYFASRSFFLPALGQYNSNGQLTDIGQSGYYWSSSASPADSNWAYLLQFSKSEVIVNTTQSDGGFYVGTFQ